MGTLEKGFVRRGEEGRGAVKLAPLCTVVGDALLLGPLRRRSRGERHYVASSS